MSPERSTALDLTEAIWAKSSHSGGQGECLELAHDVPALAPIRDSKDPAGPVIVFGRDAWHAFLPHLG
ncbi:DUF397 domain-containing protein [Streptomyces prasinus]|uniref:DUF397 domain-containing protein n=1 Tax=Streptomyces prasinus TaxID=67345 RepID=A0ABX6ATJ5_9ACTN|nr:DUF397 domain-containing protein [Streptomyces prasinus]QEV06050.1 DUF397 domain-containing protein [Streptomyces prasinus]